jgi:hypothetical protein
MALCFGRLLIHFLYLWLPQCVRRRSEPPNCPPTINWRQYWHVPNHLPGDQPPRIHPFKYILDILYTTCSHVGAWANLWTSRRHLRSSAGTLSLLTSMRFFALYDKSGRPVLSDFPSTGDRVWDWCWGSLYNCDGVRWPVAYSSTSFGNRNCHCRE